MQSEPIKWEMPNRHEQAEIGVQTQDNLSGVTGEMCSWYGAVQLYRHQVLKVAAGPHISSIIHLPEGLPETPLQDTHPGKTTVPPIKVTWRCPWNRCLGLVGINRDGHQGGSAARVLPRRGAGEDNCL